jgi:hypothetical protein
MIVGQGMVLAAVGVVVGVGLALLLAKFMAGFLFGVQPRDLLVFATAPIVLTLVAFAAAWIPPAARVAWTPSTRCDTSSGRLGAAENFCRGDTEDTEISWESPQRPGEHTKSAALTVSRRSLDVAGGAVQSLDQFSGRAQGAERVEPMFSQLSSGTRLGWRPFCLSS